jgi:hypothetical protein
MEIYDFKRGNYLYLAHPRESRHEIREWELDFERRTGIPLLNPFFEIDKEHKETDIYEENPLEAYKILNGSTVEAELDHISDSKGVVAFVDGSLSYGTIQEMVYSKIFRKPLYTLVTNGHESHPWLVYHATEIFTCRNELERRLIEKYGNDRE